ncbi:MAG: hypothetical protein KKD39_02730, partial [Candidatus Altiarchaeota archaeon]|nr:hypothetical protein [Candidatus Altiarchaeota archaeon]
GKITVEKMVELYDSHGISPDIISQVSGLEVPDNFYKLVEERHERKTAEEEKKETYNIPDGLPDTILGYYSNQETTTFKAKIIAVLDNHIILDKTYFYPEGGGQEADNGTIAGKKVVYVAKSGKHVVHKLEDTNGLIVGQDVECRLDDKRRLQLMQHHSATHLVNAAARKVLGPHIWQAGAHKSEKTSRLDITHYKGLTDKQLCEIEEYANKLVEEGHDIMIQWMKRNEAEAQYGMGLYQGGAVPGTELRIVNVVGVDVEACGGTHLKNTKEVGRIKMLSAKRIQDGVVRLEFTSGSASEKTQKIEDELLAKTIALLGAKKSSATLGEISQVFSVQPEKITQTIGRFLKEYEVDTKLVETLGQTPARMQKSEDAFEAAKSLFNAWKQNKKAAESQQEKNANSLYPQLTAEFEKEDSVKHMTENLNVKAITDIAVKVVDKTERLLIVVNISGEKVNVIVSSGGVQNAGEICRRLSSQLGGGGGGTPTLGMGGGNSKDAEKILKNFKP